MTLRRHGQGYVRASLFCASTCALLTVPGVGWGQRAVGIDVSAWQGTINWQTVARPVAQGGGGKQFAFIRATRGGTTGFYNQSDPNNTLGQNTLSQRYDDPFFVSNMNGATANGMFAGPYHFARPDIVATTLNSGGIANTGLDEANHFLEIAGPYMKPGYLLPVFDLEAGQSERSSAELSAFSVEFSNRIFEVKGIRPIIYTNQNYANYVNSTVPAAFPNLWIARWPNQSNPDAIDIQNGNPPPSPAGSNVYGKWNPFFPTIPNPQPWQFWQYASTIKVPGIGGGTQNVDGNVFQGTIEQLKDFLVPALWTANLSGSWTDASRWNSNPGLPGPNDRVILDRPSANVTVTLSSGTHNIRSLQTVEHFRQTGGTLNVQQYARFLNTATLSGGTLSAGSVENNSTLLPSGATINTGLVTGTGSLLISGGSLNATRVQQAGIAVTGAGMLRLNDPDGVSVSTVSVLGFGDEGRVDLGREALVVNYTGTSPFTDLRQAVVSARGDGDWNGPGLFSSAAANDTGGRSGVGVVEAVDLGSPAAFLGQPVDATTVLLRYTLYGDANLSGSVDIGDFSQLAAHFNLPIARWSRGDFNYDGVVGIADFALMASNFNQSVVTSDVFRPASIPEPVASTALLSVGLIVGRRRP